MTGPRASSPAATSSPPSGPSRWRSATAAPSRRQHRRLAARRACRARPPAAEPAPFDSLNTWYYSDAPRTLRPSWSWRAGSRPSTRSSAGSDADTALFEARRCLSCGSCFGCDNCYGVCPDNAVIKLDPAGAYAYAIDLDYCKGCGICAAECPCGAIVMEPEEM